LTSIKFALCQTCDLLFRRQPADGAGAPGEEEVMTSDVTRRVERDPQFQELIAQRSRFAWSLSAAMLIIYFGFIFIIAFAPSVLGIRIGNGVTTVGIPVGLLVIVSAFVLTGIYVRRANSEFDALTRQIIERAK
jgi:uncharacterized membrane protein (DUF485 family)